MAGTTLNLQEILVPDQLATEISRKWIEWGTLMQEKVSAWQEVRAYIYATSTKTTSNSQLPWKNTTTIPKTCQIRDNLHSNYMASLFPKRKWMDWEADRKDANSMEKRGAILNYMSWATYQVQFRFEVSKLVQDYIDYGNCFVLAEWCDERVQLDDKEQVGYVGPRPRRISPLDIRFNPIAPDFIRSPKIIKSILTLGDLKELITRVSKTDEQEQNEDLFQYLRDLRTSAKSATAAELGPQDAYYRMDGFHSYRAYLESDYCEVLTFYGDMYDYEKDEFLRNHIIMVVDRHKLIVCKPNPSLFGYPPIFHTGWRKRQDNLWAMGPLDNLIGMQYRVDHIENLKADVFDLITFPPLKVKGYVEPFKWAPFERIYIGDPQDGGDVEMMAPPFQVLQANIEIQNLLAMMEEMAGSPKEAMGFRTPGEKTKYEVQRLENAASRIFQAKIRQFEEELVEPLLNAMLELARRNMGSIGAQTIPVINEEFDVQQFLELSAMDITGAGRLKPVAAKHFAEKAEIIQNLTQFFSSPLGQDPAIKAHWSSIGLSTLFEEFFDLKDYGLVREGIRLSEEADLKRQAMVHEQQVQMEAQTPSGLHPDDYDPDMVGHPPQIQQPQ